MLGSSCLLWARMYSTGFQPRRVGRQVLVSKFQRVTHVTLQPQEKVRAFLLKYQDRVLHATDDGVQPGDNVNGAGQALGSGH